MSYKFFKPLYNPPDLSGLVGGSITSQELSGYIGELFYHRTANPVESTGVLHQYRKVFVKNTYSSDSVDTKVWFDAQHMSGQMYLATEVSTAGTGTVYAGATGLTSWSIPASYSGGVALGDMAANGTAAIWLRQTLSGIESSNPYVSLRMYVGGVVD